MAANNYQTKNMGSAFDAAFQIVKSSTDSKGEATVGRITCKINYSRQSGNRAVRYAIDGKWMSAKKVAALDEAAV